MDWLESVRKLTNILTALFGFGALFISLIFFVGGQSGDAIYLLIYGWFLLWVMRERND